jgi:hypothetical protein
VNDQVKISRYKEYKSRNDAFEYFNNVHNAIKQNNARLGYEISRVEHISVGNTSDDIFLEIILDNAIYKLSIERMQ